MRVLRTLFSRWIEHDVPTAAAAIAFYSLFMLAPTLVLAVTFGRWVLGDAHTQEELRRMLGHFLTPEYVDALVGTILGGAGAAGAPTLIATAFLLYGASATFAQVRSSLNRILGHEADTWHEQLWATVLGRLLAIGFVIGVVMLELLVAIAYLGLQWAADRFSVLQGWPVPLLQFFNLVLSWSIVSAFFLGVLHFLPMRKPTWRQVWPGALVAVLLFQGGKYALGLYLSKAAIASAYGSAGALVAILIWIYYSSQTLLLGAEVVRLRIDATERTP